MSKENQIVEIAELLWHFPKALFLNCYNDCEEAAKLLYDEGWRKQREGFWITVGYGISERVVCSNCKSEKGSFMRPPFCNQCGAKMKGVAE